MKNKQSLLLVLFCMLGILPCFSQATRTWVSGLGDDVNPCSRMAPCKTIAGAISKTAVGGEINILDPGGFGAVTITKSITIDGGGIGGSILSSGTNGIIINAPEGTVTIRNFSINGAGTTLGVNGIKVVAVKKMIVEHCFLSNFSGNGIDINSTVATDVMINDVTVHQANDGISITSPGFALIDRCSIQNVQNSGISMNGNQGAVSNSVISGCSKGIVSGKGTIIHLFANMIINNGTGLQGPGSFTSAGNNSIFASKTAGASPITEKQQ